MSPYYLHLRFLLLVQCLYWAPVLGQELHNDTRAGLGPISGEIPYIQEKLYVHTDRESYFSREIIWFRVYYVNALNNMPEAISKMGYVEILDKNNLPVLQEKISLKPGESFGSIEIPVQIPSGMYKFRAYTNWMKNFGPENFFEKAIRIINPRNLLVDSAVTKTKRYDIQFFPEGGNLVENLESTIGFRITDEYGKGLDCEGILLNTQNDTLLKFHPVQMGLGTFILRPVEGQSYKTIIRFPGGQEFVRNLPAIYASGYVMHLSKHGETDVFVQVKSSSGIDLSGTYLIVHDSHTSLPGKKVYWTDHKDGFTFRLSDLQAGISQFTLYNAKDQAVCERLFFRYPQKKLFIKAEAQSDFATRKKIDLELSSTDQSGNPVQADMSVSVYRLDSMEQMDESNIRYYLYLTSFIGPVESPGYYFQDSASREAAMDNLMLTHGWRRYKWDAVGIGNNRPEFPPEYNGHIIRGKVISSQTGAAIPWVKVYFSIPSQRTQFRPTISDANGNVKVEMTGFYGSQELIVQNEPAYNGTASIEIASPFFQKYSSYDLPSFSTGTLPVSSIQNDLVNEQVQRIYSGREMKKYKFQEVDTNSFYFEPDEKYMLDDYTRFLTMEEVLREYVHSSNVTGKEGRFNIRLVNNEVKQFFDLPPLILIDGVPFFEPNELFQQDPKKISRLDLVNKEYTLGDITFPGIINVTTYNGDLGGIQMNAHATVLDYPGIPEQREFYAPVYETEKQIMSRKPDFRTVLYWAPEIKSGLLGKTRTSFYTSDLPGKYAIVVQGLTALGEPGSQVSLFEVKK